MNQNKTSLKEIIEDPEKYLEGLSFQEKIDLISTAMLENHQMAVDSAQDIHKILSQNEFEQAYTVFAKATTYFTLRAGRPYLELLPVKLRTQLIKDSFLYDEGYHATAFPERYIDLVEESQREYLVKTALKTTGLHISVFADKFMEYVPVGFRDDLFIQMSGKEPARALKNAHYWQEYVSPDIAKAVLKNALESLPSMVGLSELSNIQEFFSLEEMRSLVNDLAQRESLSPATMYYPIGSDVKGYLTDKNTQILDMRDKTFKALKVGRLLNENHNEPDNIRFESIMEMSAKELAELIVYGRDELYTSSYLYTFNHLLSVVDNESVEGFSNLFDTGVPEIELALFMEQATVHNEVTNALSLLNERDIDILLKGFKSRIESKHFSSSIAFAEIVGKLDSNSINRDKFLNTLDSWYRSEEDTDIKLIYEITMAQCNNALDQKRFKAPNLDSIKTPEKDLLRVEELVGDDGINRQLMIFTDDKDGKDSFKNFINTYSTSADYHIDKKEGYVKISSVSGKVPIELFANFPESSPNKILESISNDKDGTKQEVDFDIIIHRGHSYNLYNSIGYFSNQNSLIVLGSCGGYNQVDRVLQIAPQAHIISTKQTGSMYVNDPLLFRVNEHIRQEGQVDWRQVQTYLDQHTNAYAKEYLLPPNNTALKMQGIFNVLHEKNKSTNLSGTPDGDRFDLRINKNAVIDEFETYLAGIDYFKEEDLLIVGNDVSTARIEQRGPDLDITFQNEAGLSLPDYRVTIKNYSKDLRDIDIYQFNRLGDLVELDKGKLTITKEIKPSIDTESNKKEFNKKSQINSPDQPHKPTDFNNSLITNELAIPKA